MTIADIKKTAEQKMQTSRSKRSSTTSPRCAPAAPIPALLDHDPGGLLRLDACRSARWPTSPLLDARTISVQPWEKGMGAKIEKAIRESRPGPEPRVAWAT